MSETGAMFANLEDLNAKIDATGLSDISNVILQVARPSVYMTCTTVDDAEIPAGASKFGGNPDIYEAFEWPYSGEFPLTFIAQFKLSDIAAHYPADDEALSLPTTGILYFFYEASEQPWGEYQQREGWRIIYVEDEETPLKRLNHPVTAGKYSEIKPFPVNRLTFSTVYTLPARPDENPLQLASLSEDQISAYWNLIESSERSPLHYLYGYAWPIQGAIKWECVDWSRQIQPEEDVPGEKYKRYSQAQLDSIKAQMADWQFLFQIDSDDNLDAMWGDAGSLYVCIPKTSLQERKFEDCWTIMQCC